jgi:hypothetical protein
MPLRKLKVAAEVLLSCFQWQLGELFVENGKLGRRSAKSCRDDYEKISSPLSQKIESRSPTLVFLDFKRAGQKPRIRSTEG